MNRDFKGIWISKEIWLSKNLTLQEKVFLVEIDSLDNENGCFANNQYFSDFFGISKTRVSIIINSLIEKGFIISEIKQDEGNKRILKTLLNKSLRPSQTKVKDPLKQKFKHNNTINNKKNNTLNKQPTYLEFSDYAKGKAKEYNLIYNDNSLKQKYDAWLVNNWKDGNNKKIVNWKSKLLNTLKYIFNEGVQKVDTSNLKKHVPKVKIG